MSDTLMIKVRKWMMKVVKPFTVAQPFFSALLIGSAGLISINYAQSEIATYENICSEFESSLIPYKKYDAEVSKFFMLNVMYQILNSGEIKFSNSILLHNEFSWQGNRARNLALSYFDISMSLASSKKILEQIPKNSDHNFIKLQNSFSKSLDDAEPIMFAVNDALNDYGQNYESKDHFTIDDLLLDKEKSLLYPNKEVKEVNKNIDEIVTFLKIKKKHDVFMTLIFYWLIGTFVLYTLVQLYISKIKIEEKDKVDY